MKVLNSSQVSSFGGLNYVLEAFNKLGVDKVLNEKLLVLPKQCKYNWKDIFYSF